MWGELIGAGIGLIKGLTRSDAVSYMNQGIGIGTTLSNTSSRDVFKLLGRYDQGKNNYKDFISQDRFGQHQKVSNANMQEKTSDAFSKFFSNPNKTNMNANRAALQGYMNNRNESFFKTATKEAGENVSNFNSLKASGFNDARFTTAVDRSREAKDHFGKSLASAFTYNKQDIQGTYRRY